MNEYQIQFKERDMSSIRKFQANIENSGLSSGPKTVRGKNTVRQNAFKHGCYASELFALPELQQEFARLEKELREQLKPTIPLQCIKVKEVVYCACQCELAAQADMQRMNVLLFPPDTKEPADGKARLLEDWYGASPQSLRNAIRFLESLKNVVKDDGPCLKN